MTNGCSGNSIYRFINYVKETGSDIEQVFEEADNLGNGNGNTTKGELKKFLDSLDPEWGLSKSDAADIFKTFNTYTSGRGQKINEDDDVQSTYEALMENFAKIEEAVEKELENYDNDDISVDDIMNALAGKFDKNLNINNLQNILPKLVAQAVAVVIAENALEAVANTYDDLPPGYDATKDDDLIGLLNSYINSLQGRTDNIEESIDEIIDAYINNREIEDELASFGWNPKNGLSELQKQEILNEVKSVVMENELWIKPLDAEALLDKAISDFIDEKLLENPNWQLGGNILEEFKNSKSGQVFLISTIYTDFWADDSSTSSPADTSDLYCKEIAKAFGGDFAELLAKGDKNIPAYQDILQQVAEMVKKGEVEPDKAVQKIIQLIAQNYAAIGKALGLGSDMPVDKAYELFTSTYNEESGELEVIKANAIRFLDAASAYNNSELNTVIKDKFTENYADFIKDMAVPSVIKDGVKAVKDKYDGLIKDGVIIDMDKLHASGSSEAYKNGITTFRGDTVSNIDASMQITNDNGSILTNSPDHQITYHATGNGFLSDVSITNDGKLSFKAGNEVGTATITVDVLVNGKVVGTENIKVNIKKVNPDLKQGIYHGVTIEELCNTPKFKADDVNFSCLEFNKKYDCLSSGTVITSLCSKINDLGAAFKQAGYPDDIVQKVVQTTKNYYHALLQLAEGGDRRWHANRSATYTDTYDFNVTYTNAITNQVESSNTNIAVRSNNDADAVNDMDSVADKFSSSGIYVGRDYNKHGDDKFYVFVDMSRVAIKMRDFFKQAESLM